MTVATILFVVGAGAVFAALFLGLAAVTALSNEARGVSKSLQVIEAFTTAPAPMQAELDPSFNDRVVTPLLDRLVGTGRRLTPADYTDRLRQKLDIAGNPAGWTADRVIALKVLGLAAGAGLALLAVVVFGIGLGPSVAVVGIATAAGFWAPNLYLYQKGYDRNEQMQRALPDALDLLTISVEAGLGFDAALQQVSRNTDGPLANEFARVLQEMQIGLGRSAALRSLGERTTMPDLKSFVSAMVQADAFGIPVAQVLRVQAGEIRTKRRQRAEEKAQKVAVKILLPLILCILPCLFLAVLGPAVISMIDTFAGM